MKTTISIFMGVILLLGAGWGWAAVSPAEPPASRPGNGREGTPRDVLAADFQLAPMLAEIKAALDSARLVETELQAELGRTEEPGSIDRIRAQIAAHELAVKIRVLEIQARHVRAEGRTELAQLIEARLADLREQRPPIARAVAAD